MTQVLKNKKGVTLVELLAVIVIMGIIAAIAVPAIGGLIDNSREKAVIGDLTSLTEAARLYAIDVETDTAGTVGDLVNAGYISIDTTTYVGFTFTVTNSTVTITSTSITIGGKDYVYSNNVWKRS